MQSSISNMQERKSTHTTKTITSPTPLYPPFPISQLGKGYWILSYVSAGGVHLRSQIYIKLPAEHNTRL